jgi:Polyketide synthase dehydratase
MADLEEGIVTGKSYKFNKPMIYKMVSGLAQFDPNYRALNQIILDSDALEASSVVGFADVKTAGSFHTHPAYIDALSQAGGFVMNCNDKADLNVEVFVNHGWQSFQLFEELSATNTYQTHVSMREKPGKMWEGNVMVLDGEKVVAAFGGVVVSCSLFLEFKKCPFSHLMDAE